MLLNYPLLDSVYCAVFPVNTVRFQLHIASSSWSRSRELDKRRVLHWKAGSCALKLTKSKAVCAADRVIISGSYDPCKRLNQ